MPNLGLICPAGVGLNSTERPHNKRIHRVVDGFKKFDESTKNVTVKPERSEAYRKWPQSFQPVRLHDGRPSLQYTALLCARWSWLWRLKQSPVRRFG